MHHVEIERGAARENDVEIGELRSDGASLVRMAPEIEPAGPVFGGEEWLAGALFSEYVECGRGMPAAEVDAGEDTVDFAGGEGARRVDRVEELFVEAGGDEDIAHVVHVGVVVGEIAVLIFNLRSDDGAAVFNLQ
jgi:hypothetical protein